MWTATSYGLVDSQIFLFLAHYRHGSPRGNPPGAASAAAQLAGFIFSRRLRWRLQGAPFYGPRCCCTTACMGYCYLFFYLSAVWRAFLVRPVACLFVDVLSLCISLLLPIHSLVLWRVLGRSARCTHRCLRYRRLPPSRRPRRPRLAKSLWTR